MFWNKKKEEPVVIPPPPPLKKEATRTFTPEQWAVVLEGFKCRKDWEEVSPRSFITSDFRTFKHLPSGLTLSHMSTFYYPVGGARHYVSLGNNHISDEEAKEVADIIKKWDKDWLEETRKEETARIVSCLTSTKSKSACCS